MTSRTQRLSKVSNFKVGIAVAENPPQSGVRLLVEHHKAAGHTTVVFDLRDLPENLTREDIAFDAIHVRASHYPRTYHTLKKIESLNIPVVKSAEGFRFGRDKWLCYQACGRNNLPIIPTWEITARNAKQIAELLRANKYVVLKQKRGHSGNQVKTSKKYVPTTWKTTCADKRKDSR